MAMRCLVLEDVTVAELLALKAGGFFEGGSETVPVSPPISERPAPVVKAPPAPVPDQQLTRYRPVPVEAVTEAPIEASPAPVEAPVPAPVVEAPPAPVAAPVEVPPVAPGAMPSIEQLAVCTKLRDVLQLLLDGGLPAADLTPYLEMVKPEVPLLQRISNIGDRVTRTLSVMGQGG